MSAMVTAIFTLSRAKDQHGPAIDVFKSMWKNYMKVWDDRLGKQRYAAGGEVTVATSRSTGWSRASKPAAGPDGRICECRALGRPMARARPCRRR